MDLSQVFSVEDLESAARATLDPAIYAYVAGGAGEGRALAANRAAFEGVTLRPRAFMGGDGKVDLGVTLFGRPMASPVLLAPTSPQRLLHPRAELETAAGAARHGAVSIVSTDSHAPFHEIAAASQADCWFQLYCYRSRRDVQATVDYAVRSGARAIVLTIDADHAARRLAARRAGFRAPPGIALGTLSQIGLHEGDLPAEARLERISFDWADLAWLRARVSVPLLVKGVLRGSDARRCIDLGVDGIIVSNHGGRQLDGAAGSLTALSEVLAAVDEAAPVLLDSGVRSGLDVARALSLGAAAVCVGRPYLWGLALAGADGVAKVLELLRDELADTLRQLGCRSAAMLHDDLNERSSTPVAGRASVPAFV